MTALIGSVAAACCPSTDADTSAAEAASLAYPSIVAIAETVALLPTLSAMPAEVCNIEAPDSDADPTAVPVAENNAVTLFDSLLAPDSVMLALIPELDNSGEMASDAESAVWQENPEAAFLAVTSPADSVAVACVEKRTP